MGIIIAMMLSVAAIVVGTGLLTNSSVSSVGTVADAWKAMEVRHGEIYRTSLAAVKRDTVDNDSLDYTLKNSGQVSLADFDAWDLTVQYYDASGNYLVKWLPRTTTGLANDEWKITGIYIDTASAISEIFEPNVLGASEEMVIRLKLAPAMGDGTNATINIAAPNGATLSETFQFLYLPSDDFESGGLTGGYGWLADWDATGSASVTPAGTPHGGTRHLRLQNSGSYIERSANLSGMSNLRLQFWAKVEAFEAGDTAEAWVSSNHTDWTTVKTWTSADPDDIYVFVDIDLSSYTMSSEFWIAFNSGMNSGQDDFYVDDLVIVRS